MLAAPRWEVKFGFNMKFRREKIHKFKPIPCSNFPAHGWRFKHLIYLDRLVVLALTLKKVILRTELKWCVQYHELRTTD